MSNFKEVGEANSVHDADLVARFQGIAKFSRQLVGLRNLVAVGAYAHSQMCCGGAWARGCCSLRLLYWRTRSAVV